MPRMVHDVVQRKLDFRAVGDCLQRLSCVHLKKQVDLQRKKIQQNTQKIRQDAIVSCTQRSRMLVFVLKHCHA